MRIAYLIEVNPYKNSGIVKKINDQIEFWVQQGHDVEPFILWPKLKNGNKNYFVRGRLYSNEILNKLPDNFIKTYLTKIFTLPKIDKDLSQFSPDVLYIRQNIWYPGLTSVLSKYNTILEVNTVDTIEINHYSKFKKMVYNFGREKVLNSSKGIISVSPDILKHYEQYTHLLKKVVSNGINLSKINKIKKDENLDRVNFVFVGSNSMKWHGIDRIIELAKKFNEYFFNIVGYNKSDFKEVPNNMKFYGWVEKEELIEIYSKNHFGLGSFSNYLVGKKIDSTLKVREYLAYGLPVLLGHIDVDFKDCEFVFKITDDDGDFIDREEIKEYVEKNKNLIIDNKHLEIIDSSVKEKERLSFFELFLTK